jgi:hypothetical protein
MGPKSQRNNEDKSYENSGEQFQGDLDSLYGKPEEEKENTESKDEKKRA